MVTLYMNERLIEIDFRTVGKNNERPGPIFPSKKESEHGDGQLRNRRHPGRRELRAGHETKRSVLGGLHHASLCRTGGCTARRGEYGTREDRRRAGTGHLYIWTWRCAAVLPVPRPGHDMEHAFKLILRHGSVTQLEVSKDHRRTRLIHLSHGGAEHSW